MIKSEEDYNMHDETAAAMQAVMKKETIKYEDEDEEYLFGVPDEEKVVAKDEVMKIEIMATSDESLAGKDFIHMSIETQLEQMKLKGEGSEESDEVSKKRVGEI